MRTNSTFNGGVGFYVTILPALFPAFVFLMITANAPVRMSFTKAELVRQIYTSQIGIREKASNAGLQVEKYLSYVHLPKGNPWCAAFVCWVLGEAGVDNPRSGWSPALFGERYVIWDREQGIRSKEQRHGGEPGIRKQESRKESGTKNQKSRHVDGILNDFRSKYVDGTNPSGRYTSPPSPATGNWQLVTDLPNSRVTLFNSAAPTTGDVFGLYFPEKGRIAHVGFIDQWDETWMISVEGNTNVAGSREGDGVYRKRRLVRTVYKVARYINH